MVDCLDVAKVQGFVTPGQYIEGCTSKAYHGMSLASLLPYCYGAIVVQIDSSSSVTTKSAAINDELVKRLSFSWLTSNPIPRKRLALVGAGSLAKVQGYLLAAASLNIEMVVFDDSSHWLSDDAYRHLREEFVPLEMTMVWTWPSELQRVDEHLHTIIVHTATQLGFKTSPPESGGLAQNKFKTRQLDTNIFCRLVRSPRTDHSLPIPSSLNLPRVPLLWRESFAAWHGNEVVIETYVEGPQIDANMLLVDSGIVFFKPGLL
ncbi:hypothetical protein N7449_007303 [Penicillium cf. viridicatum]|uniref:Uncharacterized protein n=1 Tax=Penicillium cf. viridicatum TaxID=2972119 RepID=A0A9W9MCJ7_9EURO|nr:hypothetical protein N7449_007303 [Penicillium cf. viridicatum]